MKRLELVIPFGIGSDLAAEFLLRGVRRLGQLWTSNPISISPMLRQWPIPV